MEATNCCETGPQNLGTLKCDQSFMPVTRIGIRAKYDATNVKNVIAPGDLTAGDGSANQTFFESLTNHADPFKRLYVTDLMEAVKLTQADSEKKTYESGNIFHIQDGVISFEGMFPKMVNTMLGKLKALRCAAYEIFFITSTNQFIGELNGVNLIGAEIQSQSIDTLFAWTQDKELQSIMLKLQLAKQVKFENLMAISSQTLGFDMSVLSSLIDVDGVISAASATGFTATLSSTAGGTFLAPFMIKNWLLANFIVPATVTAVTETADGVYVFTGAAIVTFTLKQAATNRGFDFPDTVVTV